ncbi:MULTISPECIES: hypothetical protein [unclassified Pseudomonas]|uniref:hypothetical protein n=1 Tax=unclassified Pseudomonas TaxID=196821 RepID=UPI000A1F7164|nr:MULTISPECIES: hypothetical protein [unclassified Pseudomonas]MDI2140589.1 hypothetical protein [Pseudomonas sp. ITA]
MTETTTDTAETSAARELRARLALGLDSGPNIEGFVQATAKDQKRFNALRRATPGAAPSDTLKAYKAKLINAQMTATVKSFMSGSPMLIGRLGAEVLFPASAEEVRATPSVFLKQILDSVPSQDLANRLLKTLKWYGARTGEQTSASIRNQLLCKAIGLYLHAPSADEYQELAGFRWQDPSHWGKSYQTLRNDFAQHLLRTKRVANTNESIVLAHIYQTQLSKDFQVPDVPPDLRYKSSVVWVNFMQGVLLADELGLDRPQPLSFQQLVNLPLELSANASTAELEKMARLRLGPALEWAICMGIVPSRASSDYSQEEIERALTALENQSENLNKAVQSLELRPPDRLQMAKRMKHDALGSHVLESDGRKLLRDDPPASLSFRDMPSLKREGYGFLDLYADGQFDDGKRWFFTEPDGKTQTFDTFRIDEHRDFHSERKVHGIYRQIFSGGINLNHSGQKLPDVNAVFDADLKNHLATIRSAYQTLILSLLASLPSIERRALERGAIKVLGLRQILKKEGKPDNVRARKGFVLQATCDDEISYYELIPSAAVIRRRVGLRSSTVNGVRTEFPLHASIPGQTYSPERNLATTLLLDWSAHLHGKAPLEQQYYIGFLDTMGQMPAVGPSGEPVTLTSSRLNAVAQCIAENYLYVDEKHLRTQARGMTIFDTLRARSEQRLNTFLTIVKGFVPFWGSIEDLLSDDVTKKIMGGGGLLLDLASFLFPIGKFISGTVRLIRAANTASRMAVKASLPSFTTLTRKLLTATVSNLNPLSGIPTLLKATLSGVGRGLLGVGHLALGGIRKLSGNADKYRLVSNLPQTINPGQWKPLAAGDRLASVKGIDDVLVRNTSSSNLKQFHLVDPVTSLPYGPRLLNHRKQFTQGRSTFNTLPPGKLHASAEVPEQASIREMLEIDGRTTLLIDGIPYRLDGDQLRRADLIDQKTVFKPIPCRVRRAPGSDVCKTSYVSRTPAPTPPPNSQDTSKGWAQWFGDTIYTPAISSQPLLTSAIKTYKQLNASLEFQKGIYARIKVRLPYERSKKFDTLEVGAIIVPAKDDSKHYVFTRLNAGDFYVTERLPGQVLSDPLVLRKAQTLPIELADELKTVYTGSLNANNTARINSIPEVERALKTMDDIAIPLGTHANPPAGMKWLKVDTSPSEALMFDHSTRMIIAKRAEGATTWARSKDAPEALRQRTAEIFDTLFLSPTIKPPVADAALRIDETMQKLQRLLSRFDRTDNARNIAYAEVIAANGVREVYVSVSGAHGTTKHLPLFRHLGANHVKIGDTTYVNVDFNLTVAKTNLELTDKGRLVAVPLTIKNIDTYTPALATRPTSLDSESKLIRVIREKYTDPLELKSVDVATTMPPCESCSLVMKEFGHRGEADALQVLWK